MQSRMYSLKEEVGKKNEVLGQRIQEMELAKRKFEEELKKFNSKNVKKKKINFNRFFFSRVRNIIQSIQQLLDMSKIKLGGDKLYRIK